MKHLVTNQKYWIRSAILFFTTLAFSLYEVQNGFSYKDMIIAGSLAIGAMVIFGGPRGVALGLVLWVLTLALGYRTYAVTKNFLIHPSELLLWLLVVAIFAQRQLSSRFGLSLPWWLGLFMPFWALAWWPLIAGDAPWDRMLNEFRAFVLLIPMLFVVSVVLREQKNWKLLVLAFFATSAWIAVLGVVEYWFPDIAEAFPSFMRNAKPELAADGFVRAQFAFWGGPQATFICVMALPLGFVLLRWCRQWYFRVLILVAAAMQILAVYIGGYRSLWFVLLLQVVIACTLRFGRHGIVIAILCLIVGVAGYQFIPNTTERAMSGIAALRGDPIDHSAQERKERALGALDAAISAPLGSGWSSAGWVHSDFLQVAVNLGVLPALIFLGGYLFTLQRVFSRSRALLRTCDGGDFGLVLLLSFIAAGAHLAVQGVQVLPQFVLPVWFVWAMVEVWLQQGAQATEPSYAYVPATFYPAANFQ